MIRRLWKTLKPRLLTFRAPAGNRSPGSSAFWPLVLGFSLWIKSYCTAELHDMRILELLLDPGSFVLQDGDPLGYERPAAAGAHLPRRDLLHRRIDLGRLEHTHGTHRPFQTRRNPLPLRRAYRPAGSQRHGRRTDPRTARRAGEPPPRHRVASRRAMRRLCAESCTPNFRPPRSAASSSSTVSATRAKELEKIHIHRADRVFVLSDDGELEHDSVSISAGSNFGDSRRSAPPRSAALPPVVPNTRVRSRSSNWPISKRPSG